MGKSKGIKNQKENLGIFHFDLGWLAEEIGAVRTAFAEYRKAIRYANDYRAHYNLARLLENRSRLGEAVKHYKEAIKINKSLHEAYCNLGCVLSRQRKFKESLKAHLKALNLKEKDSLYNRNVGIAYLHLDNRRKGTLYLQRSLILNKKDIEALYTLGCLLIEENKTRKEGIKLLRKARRLHPKDHRILQAIKDYEKRS